MTRQAASAFLLATVPAVLWIVACARAPDSDSADLSAEQRIAKAQNLMVRGMAHAEVGEWPEAIAGFEEARALAGDDAVLDFNLGVVHFRNGETDSALEYLERVSEEAPPALRGRVAYVRGKLALETGDADGEAAAYRRAMELDPSEPAFPYSLSQVVPRLGGADADAEVGRLLEHSVDLWPGNARLAAELAQWCLSRSEPEARRRGLDLLSGLSEGEPRVEALVERGRAELALGGTRAPVSLRRALNLLRPGKQFQTDSASLDARLAVLPLEEPSSEALQGRAVPAVVELAFEAEALLPARPFAPDESLVEVVAFNDAVGEVTTSAREADLLLLTDRGLWHLGRDDETYRRIAEVAGGRGVVVGELDGDGWMEALVVGPAGVSLWGRSDGGEWGPRKLDPDLASAGDFVSALLADFEHDGDLDLLLIDSSGQLLLATHGGEAGLGPPRPSTLEIDGVDSVLPADLDGDVDQDLLIASPARVRTFTNWRQGEYRLGQVLPLDGKLEDWVTLDYDGDGLFDLVAAIDGQLVFWRNRGLKGLERDAAAETATSGSFDGARSLAASDLDLDGDLDLLVGFSTLEGKSGAVALSGGDGLGLLARLNGTSGRGALALDLDGDFDPDPLFWGHEGAATLRSGGGEAQGRLRVALRGLKGKVPLDGRGAQLEVWFGLDRHSFEMRRPEATVGLGGREPALVKVTWPNGISEYLFDPAPDESHMIEQELRIEGSCPFLYASDGAEMRFVTDILGLAPLGMLAGPGLYVPADPEEYLRLPDWVETSPSVELRITEELREVAYLDQTELVVVDTPPQVFAYNGERWIEGGVEGLDLRLLGPLERPIAARDARGRDLLPLVTVLDQRYAAHSGGDRLYQGAVVPGYIELEIGSDLAAKGRVALVLTGWLHWGNTSTNIARAQDPDGAPVFPYLEVPAGDGDWRRVPVDVGLPAGKTKPVVVDLSGALIPGDPRVRITTDFEVYWDRVAVAEVLPLGATPHSARRLAPNAAKLSYGGFSRWYRAAGNGPYLFDYADRRPYPWRPGHEGERSISWLEHEGFYTPFGDVLDLVGSRDHRLAIFGSGEELSLSFDTSSLPPRPRGWNRTLFLHSEGWEKDGDPNVACSQTVGPLPQRGVDYACNVTGSGEAVGGLESRWVARNRLERRVLAWKEGIGPQ